MTMLMPGERTTPEFLEKIHSVMNAEENPIKYLGIDPGKKNGICGYDTRYYLMFAMTVMADDMALFLHQFKNVAIAVVEDYKLFPNKAQQQLYSDMETPRVIGRIESWALHNEVEIVKQGPSIKKNGYAWIGQKEPKKSDPLNHQKDANAHFMFWAVRNGKINARDLLDVTRE